MPERAGCAADQEGAGHHGQIRVRFESRTTTGARRPGERVKVLEHVAVTADVDGRELPMMAPEKATEKEMC